MRLLTEDRPPREGSVRAALAAGARAVPGTVAGAVRLSVTDGPMRLVLLLTAVGGVALVVCELLGPLRFAELAGGRDDGAAVYGTVLAISFGAAAVGALLAPALRRLLARLHPGHLRAALRAGRRRRWPRWPGRTCWSSPALGFALYYVAHGSTWPLLSAVLHTRVDAAHRATAVSAMSLAMALGGIVGNLAVPRARGGGEHSTPRSSRSPSSSWSARSPACACPGSPWRSRPRRSTRPPTCFLAARADPDRPGRCRQLLRVLGVSRAARRGRRRRGPGGHSSSDSWLGSYCGDHETR